MKQAIRLTILILLSFFAVNIRVKAQDVDSSQLRIDVTMPVSQFGFIADNMGEWGIPERMNLAKQVTSQMDTSLSYDSLCKQLVTASVPCKLIVDVYQLLSQKKEGVAKRMNAAMKEALLPQTFDSEGQPYTWLQRQIYLIDKALEEEEQRQVRNGVNFLIKSK